MKKQTNPTIKAHFLRSAFYCLLLLAVCVIPFLLGQGTDEDQDDPAGREAWELLRLVDENGHIPPGALQRAYQQKAAMPFLPEAWVEVPAWTSIGPGNIGGRIRSIVIHPTVPTTMWLGAVGGGVWKTTDGGTSWTTTTDFMANLAVNCMANLPAGFNGSPTLLAGTGEGFFNSDAIQGDGIFKSLDGGSTWTQLSSTANNLNFYFVNRLAIAPSNPQVLLAATRRGVFRSTDSGGTWLQRLTGALDDVLFQPNDGTRCIASTHSAPGKAYYSTDAGLNFTQATGVVTANSQEVARIELAYSRSNPSIVYASAELHRRANHPEDPNSQLYRSTDGGHSFVARGAQNYGASWYNNPLWVDPTNSNTLVFGSGSVNGIGPVVFRSTDGGNTVVAIPSGHADVHVIVNHPNYDGTNNKTVYIGNDGGIFRIDDIMHPSPAPSPASLNHTLRITQFYGGAGNVTSRTIIGGTQDNGTPRYLGNPEGWTKMFGGDGGFCAADQTDRNYFYGEYINLQIYRSTNGGASASYIWNGIARDCGTPPNMRPCANFIAPFVLDPSNPNTLLGGGTKLWRSVNAKAAQPSWMSIKDSIGSNISAVAVAPDNSDIIWVGHNNGSIFYTMNGTATTPTWTQVNTVLPARYCTRITIDNLNQLGSRYVYVTFGGFNADNVWRTINNGLTWANISNGLPMAPVHSLVISPVDNQRLYIGTHVGIFASANRGTTWSPRNDGPANAEVDELFWVLPQLVAATHGRSMFAACLNGQCQ